MPPLYSQQWLTLLWELKCYWIWLLLLFKHYLKTWDKKLSKLSRTLDKNVFNNVKRSKGCTQQEKWVVITRSEQVACLTVHHPTRTLISKVKDGNLTIDIATSTKSIMTTSSGSTICTEIVNYAKKQSRQSKTLSYFKYQQISVISGSQQLTNNSWSDLINQFCN